DVFGQRMLQVYGSSANYARLARAQVLGRDKGGYSATEVALAWLLHKPYPLFPVIGPRSPEELQSCLRAASLALTPEECAWLANG
ncbi:MAG: aldo/keto reductase, partial [Anaerolineae bacterium]